jgi:plasmid replication initiation protein
MKKTIKSFFIKLFRKNKNDVSEILIEPTDNVVIREEIKTYGDDADDLLLSLPAIPHEEIFTIKSKKSAIKKPKTANIPELSPQERAARDISEMMDVPFLALSKNRKKPIIYEKNDGENMIKVNVFPPSNGFVASIYDWDIILFVAGKIQKIFNDRSDIPPRTIIVPRHEILKALKKHDGKKQELDLNAALSRLQSTTVKTTIGNKQYKNGKMFSFLDSWGYTERKDIREIEITLSDWLYRIVCAKGALLMVNSDYFSLTSGLKKFLYRTARKHVGIQGGSWKFLIETLYEKSGSERDFRFFKRDLKAAILENDIPGYIVSWVELNKKTYVNFNSIKYKNNKEIIN